MKKKILGYIRTAIVWLILLICVVPFLYVMLCSFWTSSGVSFHAYYDVFLRSPQYLLLFWKSLLLSSCIVVGQLIISTLAGYGFAKCRFKGQNVLLFLLMIIMVLPLQVTMVPNYIILTKLGILDTYYALVLPAVFTPLGTFIMTQSFKALPVELVEMAELDGCGLFGILLRVAIPASKSGLVCTVIFSFLDSWNMIEQPLTYLKNMEDYPIAAALASSPSIPITSQLVCRILMVIPPLFLCSVFNQDVVNGVKQVNNV